MVFGAEQDEATSKERIIKITMTVFFIFVLPFLILPGKITESYRFDEEKREKVPDGNHKKFSP